MNIDPIEVLPPRQRGLRGRLAESRTLGVLYLLLSERKGALGASLLAGFVLIAIFARQLAPYDPNELHLDAQLAPPSAQYLFGGGRAGPRHPQPHALRCARSVGGRPGGRRRWLPYSAS